MKLLNTLLFSFLLATTVVLAANPTQKDTQLPPSKVHISNVVEGTGNRGGTLPTAPPKGSPSTQGYMPSLNVSGNLASGKEHLDKFTNATLELGSNILGSASGTVDTLSQSITDVSKLWILTSEGTIRLVTYIGASVAMEFIDYMNVDKTMTMLLFSAAISLVPILDEYLRNNMITMVKGVFDRIRSSELRLYDLPAIQISYVVGIIILLLQPLTDFIREHRERYEEVVKSGAELFASICNILLGTLMLSYVAFFGAERMKLEITQYLCPIVFVVSFISTLLSGSLSIRAFFYAFPSSARQTMNVLLITVILFFFKDRITPLSKAILPERIESLVEQFYNYVIPGTAALPVILEFLDSIIMRFFGLATEGIKLVRITEKRGTDHTAQILPGDGGKLVLVRITGTASSDHDKIRHARDFLGREGYDLPRAGVPPVMMTADRWSRFNQYMNQQIRGSNFDSWKVDSKTISIKRIAPSTNSWVQWMFDKASGLVVFGMLLLLSVPLNFIGLVPLAALKIIISLSLTTAVPFIFSWLMRLLFSSNLTFLARIKTLFDLLFKPIEMLKDLATSEFVELGLNMFLMGSRFFRI